MSLTSASPSEVAEAAKSASHVLGTLSVAARDAALAAMHAALADARDAILAANARDLERARAAAAAGQSSQSLVARLDLGRPGKWDDMLKGILDVRGLDDPGKQCRPVPSRPVPREARRWAGGGGGAPSHPSMPLPSGPQVMNGGLTDRLAPV